MSPLSTVILLSDGMPITTLAWHYYSNDCQSKHSHWFDAVTLSSIKCHQPLVLHKCISSNLFQVTALQTESLEDKGNVHIYVRLIRTNEYCLDLRNAQSCHHAYESTASIRRRTDTSSYIMYCRPCAINISFYLYPSENSLFCIN